MRARKGGYTVALREEYERSGNWLFRWRSYLPLFLVILLFAGLKYFHYPRGSHHWDRLWEMLCMGISFFGLAIRVISVGYSPPGTSGRNTTSGQAAASLNTTGMYSIVRHPLYAGNFFIILGLALFMHEWWITTATVIIFLLYYERIMFAEEEFLRRKFGQAFVEWAAVTPAYVPSFKNWKRPAEKFSWRKVLRREYSAFFGIIASYTALELVTDWKVEGKPEFDRLWFWLFIVGLSVYVLLKWLKKKTRLLQQQGR